MPAGRDEATAERNRQIKMAAQDGVPPRVIADIWAMPKSKVYRVLADPDSHLATRVKATPVVRLRTQVAPGDPISHGSESGYRRCRQRPAGACEDCLAAHALEQRMYQFKKQAMST